MAIDISQINFFMPVFSFLFVSLVVYAILLKSKVIGEDKFFLIFIAFIMGIIFMSFSSLEQYVRTIVPWFIVMTIIVFLVLVLVTFSTKDADKIFNKTFGWAIVVVLIIVFIIAAINVFNPVFHPETGLTSGTGGEGTFSEIYNFIFYSKYAGSILLLVIAAVVAFAITRGGGKK